MNPTPPHSDAAEKMVIGTMLFDPMFAIPRVASVLQNHESFYDVRHRAIYRAIMEMHDRKMPIEAASVYEFLKSKGNDGEGCDLVYLATVMEAVPGAVSAIDFYTEIVKAKHRLREMIKVCSKAMSDAYHPNNEAGDILSTVEAGILSINSARVGGAEKLSSAAEKCMAEVNRMIQNEGEIPGLSTGLSKLDDLTCGLIPGDLHVIAARPSLGKTSLALNICEHLSVHCGVPTGFVSLEMKSHQLALRLISSLSETDSHYIRRGKMKPEEKEAVFAAAAKCAESPLFISDSRESNITTIKAKIRRMVQEHGIKAVFVDYIQLASGSGKYKDNRALEVGEISAGLKDVAGDLSIPVVALSQLNREVERTKDQKPTLADLRDSGAIEQDADLVAMLWAPKGMEMDARSRQWIKICVRKQRNGPVGEVDCWFHRPTTKFTIKPKVELPFDSDQQRRDWMKKHEDHAA